MSSQRWHRMAEVFQEVLDHPAGERDAFLRRQCPDDPTLRRAVESLLEADREADAFLEEPLITPPTPMEPEPRRPARPERVGSYRVLRRIGQGGMSSVFLAVRDDDTFQRRVAVKVLRQGMESVDALRRLRTERQILAGLDHPSIAELYDGGTTADGLPYFVMEYIEGAPIDAYCDRNELSVEERIALFCRVCEAVHDAHRNLVVHRDLKPSNILVTADGSPKLLDFGIAKLLNPELAAAELEPTATWLRLMTPHYASPEQIRGEMITTASDVYSLGVLLYKLLTGSLPHRFDGKTPREIERHLGDREPVKPSVRVLEGDEELAAIGGARPEQLSRRLGGDLDHIVLKALRGAPRRRYGSVEQLSEDLRRFSQDQPVLARQGNLRYRAGKFLRRHRTPVAASAIVLLLVLGSAVILAVQSARIARERDQAQRERDEKEEVIRLVVDIFDWVDPAIAQGEELTVREALDRGEARLARIEGQPAVEATLRHTLGSIYLGLDRLEEAESQFTRVRALRREIYGEESLEMADSLGSHGEVLREKGDYKRAESLSREALSLARRLVGDDSPELVKPYNRLVAVLCHAEQYEAAEPPSHRALSLARQYLGEIHPQTARALTNRAVVLRNRDDYAGAARLYREALGIQRALLGNEHPDVAAVLNNLAIALEYQGELEPAKRAYLEALEVRRKIYGENHVAVAQSLYNLATLLYDLEEGAEAERMHREAIDIYRQARGRANSRTIFLEVGLALRWIEAGELESAESTLRDGLETWPTGISDEDRWAIAWAEGALGECLVASGHLGEAETLLLRSFRELDEAFGQNHSRTRRALSRLVTLYELRGNAAALSEYRALLGEPETE